ncbi:hypothetical protein EV421DRAFT_1910376 [Armillaria borealis]|uniref:Uncharacterized protein n=1 Tax=Armillaria borealis TaxID=47425 RepID=A0AA39J063_9AGAR|nr:hypothetical protein EV421DRAFT_1910376 [Armillaria borealis]
MSSNKPSDIVYLSGRTVHHIGEDYDVKDPIAEREYYDQLAAFCRARHCGRSLSIGDSFDVTLPTLAKPEGGRKLPPFSHIGGIICSPSPRRHNTRFRRDLQHNCFEDLPTSLLLVVSRTLFSAALSSKQLASCEDCAYSKLKDLQGTVLSYFYGKHKLPMKNMEMARVLILEYIHGPSLEEWNDSFPEHSAAEYPRNNLPFYDIMLSQAKMVVWFIFTSGL